MTSRARNPLNDYRITMSRERGDARAPWFLWRKGGFNVGWKGAKWVGSFEEFDQAVAYRDRLIAE